MSKAKREVPANFMEQMMSGKMPSDEGADTPTKDGDVEHTPTISDHVRDSPTTADTLELVRVTARISKSHREALEAIARRDGRLLSEVVREAIRKYLQDA